ncbi:putative RNA methylase [Halanaeroarchaeum sp. HSR-CO]|uniref:METTL5 family protein n=1 Tax=Halanaeroarchaeum sp. HSR-CO TaxID=2866382 RepID=UPI00217E4AB3|nr:METTL5 family protein [Halanaeroarchaeum sp. HSR-CO]UWG47947.1 putative RNA methylase [Halanaeroarchaeum sp. HSR-CO]
MKRDLARRLESVSPFDDPAPALEQYRTPADIAAHVVHVAAMQSDLDGRTVVDLGSGTGMLALAAAFGGPRAVVGVELDGEALERARENERQVDPPISIDWIEGDATTLPVCLDDATVVMNPPFGAQYGNRHADRAFLETAATIGAVSYSIHNEGSRSFVDRFVADHDGTVTHAYQAELEIPHQFEFHREERRTVDAEVFRVTWSG